MIKKHRYGSGLERYKGSIEFKDDSISSPDYFSLLDIPNKLYLGKNSFRIRANSDTLVKNSKIYIDCIDSNGNTIYHEVANFLGNDGSRLIILYIYEDTPPGEATLYIAGRRKKDPKTGKKFPYSTEKGSDQYHDIPNILWSTDFAVVTNKANNDEIIFTQTPKVRYRERTANYQKLQSGQNRLITDTGSANSKLSLNSTVTPEQYSSTTDYTNETLEGSKDVNLDPDSSGASLQSNITKIPEYGGLSVITSENFDFNSDMEGGKLIVNDLDSEYTTYVISVLDKNNIEVSPPYYHEVNSSTTTEFSNATNFTMSYWTSDVSFTNVASESFLELELDNIEPEAGHINRVRISYKPYGTFGEFKEAGVAELSEQNVLTDSNNYQTTKTEVVEKEIGNLKTFSEYGTYWENSSSFSMSFQEPKTFERGFTAAFDTTESVTVADNSYLGYFKVKDNYQINAKANTEYKLQFTSRYTETGSVTFNDNTNYKQVDVYISSSVTLQTNEVNYPKLRTPINDKSLGTYVGSVSTAKGTTSKEANIFFKTNSTGSISPVFVIRNGNVWEFKNIRISPRNKKGYSPNSAKLTVPINTFKKDNELVLRLNYENEAGRKADVQNELYGLYFSGSDAEITEIISSSTFISSSVIGYEPKQVFYGSSTGSLSQSAALIWDYDTDTLKVSSSIEIDGDGTNDAFKVKQSGNTKFKINQDGIIILDEFTTTPTSVPGGLMYSGSNLFLGL